jgi:WD40 repeat protein
MFTKSIPRQLLSLFVFVLFCSWPSCKEQSTISYKLEVTETLVASFSSSPYFQSFSAHFPQLSIAVSPNSKQIAYVDWKEKKHWQIMVRGVETKQFDYFGTCSPCLDGWETYACFDPDAGEILVSRPQLRTRHPEPFTKGLIFSPDGSRLAFFSKREKGITVTVDGQEGKPFDHILFHTFEFSQDSKHYSYRAMTANQEFFLFDGADHKLLSEGHFAVSPTGKLLAYPYKNESGSGIMIDGKPYPYDDVAGITFNPVDDRLVYAAKRGDQWFVVSNEGEGKPYDSISKITFSPDGKHLAYVAQIGANQIVVLDGIEGELRKSTGYQLVFSPGGEHLAYQTIVGKKGTLVIDEIEGEKCDYLHSFSWGMAKTTDLVFSPDGQRVAYIASASTPYKMFVVVEDIEGKRGAIARSTYDEIITTENVLHGAFSPDSKRFGFSTKSQVNIDGKESVHYAKIGGCGLVFSHDSKHFAFAAKKESAQGGKWVMIMDWLEGKEYDDIYLSEEGCIGFDVESKVRFIARIGTQIYLVEQHIQ